MSKVILKDKTEYGLDSFENREKGFLLRVNGITLAEIKEKFTETNTELVTIENDMGEAVAECKGYVIGNSITYNSDTETFEFLIQEPSVEKLVEQNTADITAINEAIASLAEIVGGE